MQNKNIRLHIDDGSMGGGGPIPHREELTEDMEDFLYLNTGFDGTGGFGFTPSRQRIFHYCIIAHYNDGSHSTLGESRVGSDELQVFDQRCKEGSTNDEKQLAKTFMHELGHNLGLEHPEDDPDVPDDADTSMQQGWSETVKYHSTEWSKLDFSSGGNIG